MIHVLFICLGNICRSPMAEAVFQQMVTAAGLQEQIRVDSAGTGSWHLGEAAHRRTRQVLSRHGIEYHGRARQLSAADMTPPNSYLVAMDASNLSSVKRTFGRQPRLYRLLDFAPARAERDVPDPYYENNFEYVYELVREGCQGLLRQIRADHAL